MTDTAELTTVKHIINNSRQYGCYKSELSFPHSLTYIALLSQGLTASSGVNKGGCFSPSINSLQPSTDKKKLQSDPDTITKL